MGTEAPTTLVIPIRCAPKKTPCPKWGRRGRRKRTSTRTVRTVAYKAVASLEITYGEYAARCGCRTTFRNNPEGVLTEARYDNKVRDPVPDRLLKDGMSIERALASIRRESLLDLSTGFVYGVLRAQAASLDMAAHRRRVLEHFSGTLCVDELHLGRFTLLLATDPPVAFALVGKNDRGHMGRSLGNLKTWGLRPRVVVTDGSNLDPAVLGELWPEADHQLCVFHALEGINGLILDAVRRLKLAMTRRGKAGAKEGAGPKEPAGRGRRRSSRADAEGEGPLHVQASPPGREAPGEAHGYRALRPDPDAGITGGVGDVASVRGPGLLAVRYTQGLPPGELPSVGDRARPGVPCVARTGRGDGTDRRGEVSQADGVPERPGEPPGADEQSCGADQPDVPVPGEGAVQVASSPAAGPVRGPEA